MKIVLFSNDIYIESYLNSILPKSEYQIVKGTISTKYEMERDIKMHMPDVCIFDSNVADPEISKLIEKLVTIDLVNVIYVSKTYDFSLVYSLMDNTRFIIVQIDKINAIEDFIKIITKYNKKINTLEKQLEDANNQINDSILVNKAKNHLMKLGYTENDAFKYIQRLAMDKRVSKAQIAKEILKG